MASNEFMNTQMGESLQPYNMPIVDPIQPLTMGDPNQIDAMGDPNQIDAMGDPNQIDATNQKIDDLQKSIDANKPPGLISMMITFLFTTVMGKLIGYALVFALLGVVLYFAYQAAKKALSAALIKAKEAICVPLGPILTLTGNDFCDAGPGNIVDPNTTTANYIFQTYGNDDKLYTYEVPGDGAVWYKPAAGIKTDDIEVLDYDGGANNSGDKSEYHGIEFKDKDDSIFKNSVNTNPTNTCNAGCGNTSQSKVFGLSAPNDKYEKEPKYLYRKQKGPDYVYAVFKRKDFTPSGVPNFIFITLNDDGGQVRYAVPEDSMWTDAAYKNIKGNNVENLNYSETYKGQELKGIQFKNNSDSIFKYSENDNKFNSFNTGEPNSGQGVAKIANPPGYVAESKYLYREKQGGDYIYKVFRREGTAVPDIVQSIAGDINANYIFGAYNSNGEAKYYAVPDDGAMWYKPAVFGEKTDNVDTISFAITYDDNNTLSGIRFKNNGDSIFRNSNNNDGDNSWGNGGKNTGNAVKDIDPPTKNYAPEPKYLYRWQTGKDKEFVYKVFRKKDFTPPNAVLVNKNGVDVAAPPPKDFTVTCGSSTYKNPNYIFQTVNKNGDINTYPITDDKYWTDPSNNGQKNSNYSKNGISGILFKNDDSTIFKCSTNNSDDSAWGTTGKNNWNAVTAISAPTGYSKESKYLWRDQTFDNLLYVVFKKDPVNCDLYNTNLPYECMNKIWKAAGCKKDTPWRDGKGDWAADKSRATLESDVKLYLNAESCTGVVPPGAPAAPAKPARFTDIIGGSDTKYILGTVNVKGEKKFYAINDDNYWKNPASKDVDEYNFSFEGKKGIRFESNDKTIFKNTSSKDDDNSYGTGGKNNTTAVHNLEAPQGYTKEESYAWRWQVRKNMDLIYAVFKRNDTFTADKVISRFMNRGNLKPMFY